MYRVLLVEDEEIIRKGIRYSVPWEECGCSVVGEAENGAAGEEKIAELQPDIVITDITMPVKNGLPHFSKIRPRTRCTPRIFPRFDRAPAARSRISPRFRFAPDVSPVFSQDSTFHLPRGRIREKYGSFQSYIHRFVLPLASIKPDHGSKSTRKWKRLQK